MDETSQETIAYHEAGHVVMAIYLGGTVDHVTLEPNADDGPRRDGDVRIAWDAGRMTPRQLQEKSVMVALAGPVAEMIYSGEPYHPGFVAEWKYDWLTAWNSAATLIREERKRLALLEKTVAQLYQFCSQDHVWQAIAALADELNAHETLEGEQIREVLEPFTL